VPVGIAPHRGLAVFNAAVRGASRHGLRAVWFSGSCSVTARIPVAMNALSDWQFFLRIIHACSSERMILESLGRGDEVVRLYWSSLCWYLQRGCSAPDNGSQRGHLHPGIKTRVGMELIHGYGPALDMAAVHDISSFQVSQWSGGFRRD